MRTDGAGGRFHYSHAHSHYIYPAIIAKKNQDSQAGFWCYRLNEIKPSVGDLIFFAREDGIDYDYHDNGDYADHSDLVVEVNASEIQVVGGNVGDSVTKRPILLDGNGFLFQYTINGELLFGLLKDRISERVT